jgi:hypothetical protein
MTVEEDEEPATAPVYVTDAIGISIDVAVALTMACWSEAPKPVVVIPVNVIFEVKISSGNV